MRSRLINLVGKQFCPTVLACGDRHAHNHTAISVRTTFRTADILQKCDVYLTNRKWFSVVCTLIDNDIRHHSGQNVVDSRDVAE